MGLRSNMVTNEELDRNIQGGTGLFDGEDSVGEPGNNTTEETLVPREELEKADKPNIEHRILIVHDKDQDGYCAANIIKQYKKQPTVAVGMVPWGHSKNLRTLVIDPDKWDEIFIVDLVAPYTWIMDLLTNGFDVTVMDHHKTTINNLHDLVENNSTGSKFKLFWDDKLSACGVAWKAFYNNTPMPWTVQMVNNWDLWQHEDPQVIPFHYGMECIDMSNDYIWRELIKGDPGSCSQIMQMGQMVGAFWINKQNETSTSHNFIIDKHGLKFMCCNGWFTSSYDFAAAFDKSDCDAMMWFRFTPNQGNYPWRVSFRTTKEGVDLLSIAEQYRGGGHPTACGCNLTTEEMKEWFPVNYTVETPIETDKIMENN